ncbi:MAG TPA: VanW family protein [Anaerolineales bacterium]|nr:VanW family protein [Anaerolineales bacterium]
MKAISQPYSKTPLFPQISAALIGGIALFFTLIIIWVLGYQLIYAGRIFPGVSVAGVDLSGLKPSEAAVKLNETLSYPINGKVLLRYGENVWMASPAQLGMVFDPSTSAMTAYKLGRSGGLFGALSGQIQAFGAGASVSPVIIFDQRVASYYLNQISPQINQPVAEASLVLDGTNIVSQPGQVGRELKTDATLIYLAAQLQTFSDGEVQLVVQEVQPQILDVSAQADKARQVLSQPLTLAIPNAAAGDPGPYVYNPEVLANLLTVERAENGEQVILSRTGLRDLLVPLKEQVERMPIDAKFIFNDDTHVLDVMAESRVGRSLDIEASIKAINDALQRGEHTVPLVVNEQQPRVASTSTGQELGITELVWSETSYFHGSSAERVQNIQAAASQFHGLLVAPGETFSMGEHMGDVSLENGFAEALIIYGGRTIKGVGGGVCQVSTTLFRAVFNAGFPVVERTPHAYRVSYYEQTAGGSVDPRLAGLDATVYFPLVDFKFTNDTPYWILMETYMGNGSLTWKFYSTSDGRTVSWDTTGVTNVVPAPPPVFEVNDELGKNQMKQVDWAANGADVTVTRTVMRDGAVLFQDSFTTHYQPWQAICQYGPDSRNPEKLADEKSLCRNPSS